MKLTLKRTLLISSLMLLLILFIASILSGYFLILYLIADAISILPFNIIIVILSWKLKRSSDLSLILTLILGFFALVMNIIVVFSLFGIPLEYIPEGFKTALTDPLKMITFFSLIGAGMVSNYASNLEGRELTAKKNMKEERLGENTK